MITVIGHDGGALSAVAMAFSRAGLPWDDAYVVSASGGEFRRAVNACRAHPKVAVLIAPGAGPAELARELFPQSPRDFVVCEDLGGPAERVTWCRPAEATTRHWHKPELVLVLDTRRAMGEPRWMAGIRSGPTSWALPEEDFEGLEPMRSEVRAFVLAKLGPRIGDMVWDLGSSGGSVAIECAWFGAAVVAVDRDEAACEHIRRNVRAHGVRVAVSRGTAPDVLDHLPEPDAVFIADAGPEVVGAVAARALRSVVTVSPSAELVQPALDALTAEGLVADAVQMRVGRPSEVAISAYVVWGERQSTHSVVRDGPRDRRPQEIAELPEPRGPA